MSNLRFLILILPIFTGLLVLPSNILGAVLSNHPDTIPTGMFSEPPLGAPSFRDEFRESYSSLGSEGDLVFLFETADVKYQRWHGYKARRITNLIHAIVLDSSERRAWHQVYRVDSRWSRKENDPRKLHIQRSEYKRPRKLDYSRTYDAFRLLDSVGFHRLDYIQLTSTNGPVRADGSMEMISITHSQDIRTYLKANERWYSIVSYAPWSMYNEYPELYPDRKKWLIGYERITELIE